jgi:hypothetical protein
MGFFICFSIWVKIGFERPAEQLLVPWKPAQGWSYSCYGRNWNRIDVWAVISYGIQKVKSTRTQSVCCVTECVLPRGTVLRCPWRHWEFLTLFLEKSRYNSEAVLKNYELFFMELYITLVIHFVTRRTLHNNSTLRRVRVTIVGMKKQHVLHILCVCL